MEAVNNATLTDAEKERLTKNAETQIDDNLKKLNQMMHDGLHIEAKLSRSSDGRHDYGGAWRRKQSSCSGAF